jgi:PIN domain nuclease of toxin-antitoxin system
VLGLILLDTHIWFWWINLEHHRFSVKLKDSISSSDHVAVSCVSCFEIALAAHRERLSLPIPAQEWFIEALDNSGIELIPLSPSIAARAVTLAAVHRDPFDRIIIATALEEHATLASLDTKFREYPELDQILIS